MNFRVRSTRLFLIACAGMLLGALISFFSGQREFGDSSGFALFPGEYCIYSSYSQKDPPLIVDGCNDPEIRWPGTMYYPVAKVAVWLPTFVPRPDDCYQCILEFSAHLGSAGVLLVILSGGAIVLMIRRRWPKVFNF